MSDWPATCCLLLCVCPWPLTWRSLRWMRTLQHIWLKWVCWGLQAWLVPEALQWNNKMAWIHTSAKLKKAASFIPQSTEPPKRIVLDTGDDPVTRPKVRMATHTQIQHFTSEDRARKPNLYSNANHSQHGKTIKGSSIHNEPSNVFDVMKKQNEITTLSDSDSEDFICHNMWTCMEFDLVQWSLQ